MHNLSESEKSISETTQRIASLDCELQSVKLDFIVEYNNIDSVKISSVSSAKRKRLRREKKTKKAVEIADEIAEVFGTNDTTAEFSVEEVNTCMTNQESNE